MSPLGSSGVVAQSVRVEGNGKCTDRNVVYSITCDEAECKRQKIGQYNGETYRPLSDRFAEHYRSANNPTAESYKDKPFGKHFATEHPGHIGNPKLRLQILSRASSTTDRKIKEARAILRNNPDLNDRDEQSELRKYLIWFALLVISFALFLSVIVRLYGIGLTLSTSNIKQITPFLLSNFYKLTAFCLTSDYVQFRVVGTMNNFIIFYALRDILRESWSGWIWTCQSENYYSKVLTWNNCFIW